MQTLFPPQQGNPVEERAQRANLLAWELHYHNPDAIFGHSQQLFSEFRNLEPVKGTDGTFSMRGTLEVQYGGTVYHFPLAMEMPKNYPEIMPRCHIPNDMLPPGMILSERNNDLSPEGYMRVPVLPYPANNLAGNARWCAASYQKSSPVYNRAQAPATQPAATHYNPHYSQPQQQQHPQLPATQPAYSYPPSAQNPYAQANNDDVMEELARSLRDELAVKLTTHAKDMHAKSLVCRTHPPPPPADTLLTRHNTTPPSRNPSSKTPRRRSRWRGRWPCARPRGPRPSATLPRWPQKPRRWTRSLTN